MRRPRKPSGPGGPGRRDRLLLPVEAALQEVPLSADPAAPAPPLRAEGLSVARGGRTVLTGVDLVALPGRPLAVEGPSGSGKTSLLMALGGVILPSAGRVLLGERDLGRASTGARAALRRSTVALLSQELELLPRLSVEKNAALTGVIAGLSAATALERARVELDGLELGGLLRRSTEHLSRGQRQRVALARALAHPGGVLLLDEPSTALDARLRDRLLERLGERAARGHTLVLATHDPVVAAWASARRIMGESGLLPAEEGAS